MGKNEKTSKGISGLASKVLRGIVTKGSITPRQLKSLAGTALTQTPDKRRR